MDLGVCKWIVERGGMRWNEVDCGFRWMDLGEFGGFMWMLVDFGEFKWIRVDLS